MKKFFTVSLIALGALILLSFSFSSQDKTDLKAGEYAPIPKFQIIPALSPLERLQSLYSNPDRLQGMSPQEIFNIQLGSYDSTLKGRSVLAVDIDNDGRDEVIVDFGTLGIYLYDPYRTPKWTRLDTRDPEYMIAADRNGDGKYEIFVSWGSGNGAQFWEDGVGWGFFNNTGWYDHFYCSTDIDNDGNEEIVIESQQVSTPANDWLYIAKWAGTYFSWHLITATNTNGSQSVAIGDPDSEVFTSFSTSPRVQFWNYGGTGDANWTDNWVSLSDVSIDIDDCSKGEIGDGDAEEEFIVDAYSGSPGTWIYNHLSTPKWTRINTSSIWDSRPWPRATGTNDEIVCAMNSHTGLWFYGHMDATKWNMINGLTPEADQGFVEIFNYDSDSDWDLAVDFGSTGLWKYDFYGAVKWTSMNGSDPLYMIRGNFDLDTDDELIVVFESSPAGIWIWDNSTTPKWQNINGANPN